MDVTKTSSLGILLSMPMSPTFPFHLRIKSRKADILHYHMPFPLGDFSHLLVGEKNKKVVVTYHSDVVKQARMMRFYGPVLSKFLEMADIILVTSPNLLKSSKYLQPYLDKCRAVPLSIDLHKFNYNEEIEAKPKIEIPEGEDVVLFVGRLSYYKGVEYLIEAMHEVNAKLVIVGDGPLREQLEERAESSGLCDKLFFLGLIPEKELKYWYKKSDLLVLPSCENSEAFGIVQLEAMPYKTPVINTDLPTGVPYVSKHKETGLTVPPKDSVALAESINRILNDKELKEKYGENAYLRVKGKFSMDKMLDSISSIYQELVE